MEGFLKHDIDSNNTDFINAYEILGIQNVSWDVATYKVERLDGAEAEQEDRGKIKSIIWDLRWMHKSRCPSYGFVIDIDEETVAVLQTWDIPFQENFNGYRVRKDRVFKAAANDPQNKKIIEGVLQESIKQNFKNKPSGELGYLWRDYRESNSKIQ